MLQKTFTIQTNGPRLYEFTDQIAQWVQGNGLVNLFVQHSSASLLIQEKADRDFRSDLTAFFDRLVPPATHPSMSYLTHLYEGADDMPAHIKAALLPTFLNIPLHEGQLALGAWQRFTLSNIARRRIRVGSLPLSCAISCPRTCKDAALLKQIF